ncbi:PaaI family thioesterase [Cytobacillus praedii]|uniref:Acyl-coenzyme A thioesterase THEM4 n=1 Tax=Cytobacillus praedii TaxID=1742358 RepID=A0A4R1B5R5_9BACI|nr:PaaI family thioesterase [Cytobacillus praedii]MED3552317.1 PaaI family thioesterase [Cytobacillus praedii]TCJ06108.1 PaaI family thioesterase [Cytobacillus praedii]
MKEQLRELLEQSMVGATTEELNVLNDILRGFNKKQKKINSSYIDGLLHMERTMDDNECHLTVPLSPLLNNTLGIVHGGVTATITDTAMGTLANSILPEGYGAVTTQLNIHYLAVGKGDYLQCKARIDHKGTKNMVLSADVHRSDGKKIAQATGSFFIIKKK